jgi:hypothetical protein
VRDHPSYTFQAPICLICDNEITDDKVQYVTGECVCSWECQFELEDNGIPAEDDFDFDEKLEQMIEDEMEVAGYVD